MWNQQSEKQSFPNTTHLFFALGTLVATYNFPASGFCTTQSPFRTNLDDGIWQLAVPKLYIILRQLPLLQRPGLKWAKQQDRLGKTELAPAPCFCNLNRRTRAIGKTSMVPKPGKFTTAWLPEHKTNLVPLGKTGGYLQLSSFRFLHPRGNSPGEVAHPFL